MRTARQGLVLFVVLLGCMGCDPRLDVYQENEKYYSLFGYLDASADTQFVRVEPLRDGMWTNAPTDLEVDVTLTNVDANETFSLQDSVRQFGDGTTAHNFYTTTPLDASTEYRLEVDGPGDMASDVRTMVPDTYPSPTIVVPVTERTYPPSCTGPSSSSFTIDIRGVDRLVALKTLFYTRFGSIWEFTHLADTFHTRNGTIQVLVDLREYYCEIPEKLLPTRKLEVMVAAGDPDWPDFMGLDLETRTLPATVTNVEGGVGFVGGVVTDTVFLYRPPQK